MDNSGAICYTVMRLGADAYAQTDTDIGIKLDGSASFSIDFWVKFDGLATNAEILAKDGVMSLGSDGESVVLAIAGFPPLVSNPKTQALDERSWHYVCVTYGSGQGRIYIDGKFNIFQGMSGTGVTNANPWFVGRSLEGLIKSVRIYNRVLDAETVFDYMYGTPAQADIAANLDFTRNPPQDLGPGHHAIALKEGAAMIVQYPALALGGTAYAKPLLDDEVNPGGWQVDPYTVQAQAYIASTSVEKQMLFVNSDLERETGMALYLQYDSSSDAFHAVSQRGSDVSGADMLVSVGTIKAGTWVNVATVFDGTTLALYLQGALDSSQPAAPIPLEQEEGELLIGAALSQGLPLGAYSLQGYLSRIDVWSRALEAAEIASYRDACPDPLSDGLAAVYDFTSRPGRNVVNGHAIGMADEARMSSLELPAPKTSDAPPSRPVGGVEQLDPEFMAKIRASIDFGDFAKAHGDLFEKALAADLAYGEAHFSKDERAAFAKQLTDAWRELGGKAKSDSRKRPFLVTRHRVGHEHVLIWHTPESSRVVFRADVDSIDPCTLWQVELVFVIIGGILDALFGLSSNLTQKATDFIVRRVLTNSTIAAYLASGTAFGAAQVFGLGKALYNYGLLSSLFKMVIDVGFWTVLRIIAKALLIFAGIGAADVIASLVATAITFIKVYSEKPASCDALPGVGLAAIKFNHDPTHISAEAMNIRKNYADPVTVPEWVKGTTRPEDSPAAYSIQDCSGKTVAIQVKFTINTTTDTQADIKATGGGILGAIDPVSVQFKNGVSVPVFVTLTLSHQTIGTGGVQRQDITWDWQYRVAGGAWTSMGSTSHRIYVVLANPMGPWQQTGFPNNQQLPWAEVLDFACAWAQGATTVDDAVRAVTTKVNGNLGLAYDMAHGGSKYVDSTSGSSQVFLCTEFIKYLKTGGGKGNVVNCMDCGTIVTTFASVLGCDILSARMGSSFALNKIIAIGQPGWGYPSWGPGFSYHEVAWTGAGTSYTDPLYDACLKVDNSDDPWAKPDAQRVPLLPVKMAFTTLGLSPSTPISKPFTQASYRERLCTNDVNGIGLCKPTGTYPSSSGGRRRPI